MGWELAQAASELCCCVKHIKEGRRDTERERERRTWVVKMWVENVGIRK